MKMLIKLIKRWMNMFLGKSTFHVEQGKGKCYSLTEVKGYYNDLTKKVNDNTLVDSNGIPKNITIAGVEAYFPITIFQYALGLYDLYLSENNKDYLDRFLNIAEWAIKNQKNDGMWDCMGTLKDTAHKTQSSMCQSEGTSVLIRAFIETKDERYRNYGFKAIDFMIKDVIEGGTCRYDEYGPIFEEYVSDYNLSVLNGWIFSIFGLYDLTLVCEDEKYKEILNKSVNLMADNLKKYDRKFWSNYDLKGTIASPAYHDLHIKQLWLLYEMFNIEEFKIYALKWGKYQNSKSKKIIAMIVKLKQKVFRNKYYDINTSLVK